MQSATPQTSAVTMSKVDDVVARIERLPLSWWHVKARVIVGVATFFDAFDGLAISFVLPALVPMWKLAPTQIGFMISIGYVGQLLGALLFGWVAQRHGRMRAMVYSVLVLSIMSLACAFAWSYESLLIFRGIQGIGLGGEVPIAAVYISEIARAQGRGRFVLLYELIFPIGLVCAGFLGSWVVPHLGWHYMFVIGALPAILAVFMQLLLPESPRWLAVQGRDADAEAALVRIEQATEKAIGKALPPVRPIVASREKPASWADLFGPQYLSRTLVAWTIWFAAFLVTFGLIVWVPTMYGTVFKLPLGQALQYGLITQVVGLFGTLTCALSIDYVGRRPWFALAFFGVGAALCSLWLFGVGSAERVLVMVCIAFFCSSVLSIGIYLYTPELYPTRVRAVGVGAGGAWRNIASMIGPTMIGIMIGGGLEHVFVAFGAVSLVAAVIVAVFATETKGRVLEEVSP